VSDAPDDVPDPIPAVRPGRPRVRLRVQCGICPQVFEARPSEIARGGGRYCSAECRNQARSQGIPALGDGKVAKPVPPIEVKCEVCQGSFHVYPYRGQDAARRARYCSLTCLRASPAEKRRAILLAGRKGS